MNKFKLGVIGCGFMAQAILDGILKNQLISPADLIVSDPVDGKLQKYREIGCRTAKDNRAVAGNSEFLLFAVKPQHLSACLREIEGESVKKIISILAGTKKEAFRKVFPDAAVARCMPNTPCSIGCGAVGLDVEEFSEKDRSFLASLFSALGEVVFLPESKLNAVTGISGSGPAYVYLFTDALIKAGVREGLKEEDARKLAVATVIGGGEMMRRHADIPLEQLISSVCSKGGTTLAAIDALRKNGLENALTAGVSAAVRRGEELEKLL